MNRLDYDLNWGEYFQVDELSPSGIVRVKNYLRKNINKYSVGTKFFRKNGDAQAWKLGFQGKLYYIHRIIWVMTYGSIDHTLVIDHLDGNPFNNKIENLSLKTQKDNLRNTSQYRNNKTGFNGVRLTDRKGKFYYTAQWYDAEGNFKLKYFSISKFGEDAAKDLAVAYRKEQIQQLINEGAGYTERHGT